jgi:hypothetical protein
VFLPRREADRCDHPAWTKVVAFAGAISSGFAARPSLGQTTSKNASLFPAEAAEENPRANALSFSLSLYAYFPPNTKAYVNPNLTVDYAWLHLEGRYNYEAQKTGSAWIGYNFKVGKELTLELTPMAGAVFGDLTGLALGCDLSLGYAKVELSSASEYVFDIAERSGSFFYTWSELSYSPVQRFRAGLVAQRTKAYHSDLVIQPGVLAGLAYKDVAFTVYVFNLGWVKPTVVLSLSATF